MSDRPAETYRFEGFGPNAIELFSELEKDNTKAWYDAHREAFDREIRVPMQELLMETAVRFGGEMKLFRQNRDIRFSKDKSPYKTSTYGVVAPADSGAAFYAAISSQGLHVVSGYYQMSNDQLDRFRQAVDDESTGSLLTTIVQKAEESGLEIQGEALKSAPRGYSKDHPRLRFLQMKDVIFGAWLKPGPELTDRRAFDFAMATWKTGEPLRQWLDSQVGPAQVDADPLAKPRF